MGVLDAPTEVARRIVGRTAEEAREGQHGVMPGVRHLLVAANALLRHQVGQRTADARGAVFVVDVDHQVMLGAFPDGVVEPCGPLLRADQHEAELHALDAEALIEGQDGVELRVERTLVDVKPDADATAAGIVGDLLERGLPARNHLRGVRADLHLRPVPTRVELHILEVHRLGEVDRGHNLLLVESTAEGLAGANKREVALGRRVEVEQQLLVVDQVGGLVARHDDAPRR